MEFSAFKSQVQSYQAPSPVADNIRYVLAKKKIDELFVKWMSLPQAQEVIHKLIDEIKSNPQAIINGTLTPFLTSQKANLSNLSTLNMNNTIKPTPHTPPKSPNDFAKWGRGPVGNDSGDSSMEASPRPFEKDQPIQPTITKKTEIDTYEVSKQQEEVVTKKGREIEKPKPKEEKTKDYMMKSDNKEVIENKYIKNDFGTSIEEPAIPSKSNEFIPRFYFPTGNLPDAKVSEEITKELNEIFAANKNEDLGVVQFEPITTKIFGLPKFLNSLVFARVDKDKRGKVSKADFVKYNNFVVKFDLI